MPIKPAIFTEPAYQAQSPVGSSYNPPLSKPPKAPALNETLLRLFQEATPFIMEQNSETRWTAERVENKIFFPFLIAYVGGSIPALLYQSTGLDPGLHEVAGHVFLGFNQVLEYPKGSGPSFQVDGWDNFKALKDAPTFKQGIIELFRFLTGYDRNHDGNAGVAYQGSNARLNNLGQKLGFEGSRAWISLAGSIPGLFFNTITVASGIKLFNRSPILAGTMITFGSVNHLSSSFYPISAAFMSKNVLLQQAARGHDFASFAVRIGELTHVSPQKIAMGTAALWSAILPAIALIVYLKTKGSDTEVVSDAIAIRHWILKASTDPATAQELQGYINKYPEKEKLVRLNQKAFSENSPYLKELGEEFFNFVNFLLDEVPISTLNNAKIEILKNWESHSVTDLTQEILSKISFAVSISSLASKVLYLLGTTTMPSLLKWAERCSTFSTLFIGVSVISTGYGVYKDSQSAPHALPKSAKMMNIAKLVISIASTVLFITASFTPGVNTVFIGVPLIAEILSIVIDYARARSMQHRFKLLQAIEPQTWKMMLHAYKKTRRGANENASLDQWREFVEEAVKSKILSPKQKRSWKKHKFKKRPI